MLSADAEDNSHSKINALVSNVAEIWRESTPTRGTQLIFCDMGVKATEWGYSAYEDVTRKLIAAGIPREQIASIGEADSDAKKQVLFDKVRSGTIRVLLGSTQKMGTGTNVQKRLVALHHLDAPWKPAEVEQRDGRILRQGNENPEVAIYRYVTTGSFDSYMWQALETKARFISQVMTGQSTARRAEDIGGQELSYAEVKAIASGNPAVLTLAEADAEIQRLSILKKNHADEQFAVRRKLKELPEAIEWVRTRHSQLTQDHETMVAHLHEPMMVHGQPCRKDDLLTVLGKEVSQLPAQVSRTTDWELGQYQGLTFGVTQYAMGVMDVFLRGSLTRTAQLSRDHQGPRAVLNALQRLAAGYEEQIELATQDAELYGRQLTDYQQRQGLSFTEDAYLSELTSLRDELRSAMSLRPGPDLVKEAEAAPTRSASDVAEAVQSLMAGHHHEETPVRESSANVATAERPITTRIREGIDRALEHGHQVRNPLDSSTPGLAGPNSNSPVHFARA